MAADDLAARFMLMLAFAGGVGVLVAAQCGDVMVRPPKFVFLNYGGAPTYRGQWPWHVAIFETGSSSKIYYACGGSLISSRLVLTAGHCVMSSKRTTKAISVHLGQYNINEQWSPGSGSSMQVLQPQRIMAHPSYDPESNLLGDLALILFASDVTFNLYVRPICLWNGDPDIGRLAREGTVGTVVGWGTSKNHEFGTPELMQVKLLVHSNRQCIDSNSAFQSILNEKKFCAGYRNGTTVCNGDSGGGLVFKADGDRWYIRGIVSAGLPRSATDTLCSLNDYTTFTDVSPYLEWIRIYTERPASHTAVGQTTSSPRDTTRRVYTEPPSYEVNKPQATGLKMVDLGGQKYFFSGKEMTKSWHEALKFCRSNGLELLTIESQAENQLIKSEVGRLRAGAWQIVFWAGGTDEGHEGRFVWSATDRDLGFTAWHPGEPSNTEGNQNCLEVIQWDGGNFVWNDKQCSTQRRFICE